MTAAAMLLKNCRYVVTQNASRTIHQETDILIEGNRITGIGIFPGDGIDCSRKLVMPGLINMHTHLGMGLLRGLGEDEELKEWLHQVVAAESAMNDEGFHEGSLLGSRESLHFGTTTVADMYAPMDPTVRALTETGLRAYVFPAFPSLDMRKDGKKELGEITLPVGNELVHVGVGPHSIYTLSGQAIKKLKQIGKKFCIHVAETREEQYACKKQHGCLVIEYLDKLGVLDTNTILVHGIWMTKREINILKQRGCTVVHCPISNMKLASGGVIPLKELMHAGVRVTLGTDSVVSNNNLDMFEEMKTAALLHRHHYWQPSIVSAQQMLDMATIHGADALDLECGRIEEGKLADIITLEIGPHLTPIDEKTLVNHLVYSANGNDVRDVIVDGVQRK